MNSLTGPANMSKDNSRLICVQCERHQSSSAEANFPSRVSLIQPLISAPHPLVLMGAPSLSVCTHKFRERRRSFRWINLINKVTLFLQAVRFWAEANCDGHGISHKGKDGEEDEQEGINILYFPYEGTPLFPTESRSFPSTLAVESKLLISSRVLDRTPTDFPRALCPTAYITRNFSL